MCKSSQESATKNNIECKTSKFNGVRSLRESSPRDCGAFLSIKKLDPDLLIKGLFGDKLCRALQWFPEFKFSLAWNEQDSVDSEEHTPLLQFL